MQDTPTFHPLDALIRQICGLPEVERFGALFSACRCLGGTVIQPGSASHMFEISVLGVYAGAADRHELVLNWLRGARVLRGASADVADQPLQSVAIEHNPARRGIQLAAATDMIARPDRHDDDHLISACRIILANSRDHSESERACQLAAALGHATPGTRSA